MGEVSALLMKATGVPTLISIDGSIHALRKLIGDELMLIKPFGTYSYAYNVKAQDNSETFNRLIRLEHNKVTKIYGDFIVVNSQTVNNQTRQIIVDFLDDDIEAVYKELGLTQEDVLDERVHLPSITDGIVSEYEQIFDPSFGVHKLRFNLKAPKENAIMSGSVLISNDQDTLRNSILFMQEIIGMSITDFPTISDYEDLAIVHEIKSEITQDTNSFKAAHTLIATLEHEFEITSVYIPERIIQPNQKSFWYGIGFQDTPLTRMGLLLEMNSEKQRVSDSVNKVIHTKQAETRLLQMAMDDPLLSWGAKGILQFLFVVDFQTNISQLSSRSNNTQKSVQKYIDELIDMGYLQELLSMPNKPLWHFDSGLIESILATLDEQKVMF